MKRVELTKRWGGFPLAFLRMLLVIAVWLPLPGGLVAATKLLALASEIPAVPKLDGLLPKYGSRVETTDGLYLGGSRAIGSVDYDEMPPMLLACFVAAEDEDFFTHSAFSFRAIVRAAVDNALAGETVQGASTITQQLAKQFMGREKTYQRKVKELLLARRLEANYTKSQLLDVYVRSVFLGGTAHGATQASWQYFGKSPTELSLPEMATLAGILPAPSAYDPRKNPEAALKQRNRVLRRLGEIGMLPQARVATLQETPLELRERSDAEMERLPHALSSAQRSLKTFFQGTDAWAEGGLRVVLPHDPIRQALARRALRKGVRALDERQGYRGPPAKALNPDAVDEAIATQSAVGELLLARVVEVDGKTASVRTREGDVVLDLRDHRWASSHTRKRHFRNPAILKDLRRALAVDDIVLVSKDEEGWRLRQIPAYEAAVVVSDVASGRLLASAGGFDADASIFDRGLQGCRQPGSVFKPVVYSEALSRGLTTATMLSDVPLEVMTGRGGVWRPKNADRDFRGYIPLANALAWSRNIPTIHLMDHLSPQRVVARARKLGIESVIDTASSMSLGASCLRPVEMARVYSAFQRSGKAVEIDSQGMMFDHQGDIVRDPWHFSVAQPSTAARIDRMTRVGVSPESALSVNTAYIMLWLLRRVVTSGTAKDLPDEWLVGGKTGTTNEFDGWFVGFDGHTTIVTWIGADKNDRPLGDGEHGATAALPIFQNFYEPFARLKPPEEEQDENDPPWPGEPPIDVIFERIDQATGLLTPVGEWGVEYPFVMGTAPSEFSPTRGTKLAENVDELLRDF